MGEMWTNVQYIIKCVLLSSVVTRGPERCSCWYLHYQEQEKREDGGSGRSRSRGAALSTVWAGSLRLPRDGPTKLEETMPHAFALGGLGLPTSAAGRGAESYEGCGGEGRNLNGKRRENLVRQELLAWAAGEERNCITSCKDLGKFSTSVWEIETFGCIQHSFRATVNCLSEDNLWGTICQHRVASSLTLTHSSQALECPAPLVRTRGQFPVPPKVLAPRLLLKINLFLSSKKKCKGTGTWQNSPVICIKTECLFTKERENSNI